MRLLFPTLLLAACSQQSAPPPGPGPAPKPAPSRETGLPIAFDVPAAWSKETPKSNMRKAQYRVPDKEKKASDAELALFYFGNSAAMVESNIERWQGQMGAAEAKPESIQGKLKVTLVDFQGTYAGDVGGDPLPDARMLAAVVETPEGPWYFKLVGPADTVGDWRGEFVELLKGAQTRE